MHEFYKRMQAVFTQAGSNRNQFCRKRGYNYQTLQAYWNSDKLPPGSVLEDIALEYSVSLDALVLGRAAPQAEAEDPVIRGITAFLKQLDGRALQQVQGAMKMFRYLTLTGPAGDVMEGGSAAGAGAAPAAAGGERVPELIPDKTEKALSLLTELSLRIRQGSMGREDKNICRAILGSVVQNIYEREVKDEWAELEELP
jgi:hypothetical protein